MLAECGGCGTRFAPDLDRCPHCGSEERAGEMPKITADGPTYAEGHAPGDGEEHVHPQPAETPEGAGEAAEPAAGAPETPAEPAAPSAPPSAPPRRIVPPEPPGE